MVAAIVANGTTNPAVSAAATPTGVDLTARTTGTAGNQSGAKLTGGADAVVPTVTVTFSGAVNTPTLATFARNNSHTFGTGATGSYSSATNTYTITLGTGASIATGDTLTVSGVTDPDGSTVATPTKTL